MVEPATEVDGVDDEIEKKREAVGCPANDESTAYNERRDDSVTSHCADHWTAARTCLIRINNINASSE